MSLNNGKKKVIISILIIIVIAFIVVSIIMLTNLIKESNKGQLASPENINSSYRSANSNNELSENSNTSTNRVSNTNSSNTSLRNNAIDNTTEINKDANNTVQAPSNSSGVDIIAKDKNKVSIEIVSSTLTLTGGTIKITDKNNTPYNWGPAYKLQIKQDGAWTDMTPLREMVFEQIEYNLDENGQVDEQIDWTEDYGTLEPGSYRIVKTTYYEEKELNYYAEFLVN